MPTINWPAVIGDAFWILALSLIANASLHARRRLDPSKRLPLPWGFGRLGIAMRRDMALTIGLGLPFGGGAALLVLSHAPPMAGYSLLICLVRVFAAGAAAWLHLVWLNGVLHGARQ